MSQEKTNCENAAESYSSLGYNEIRKKENINGFIQTCSEYKQNEKIARQLNRAIAAKENDNGYTYYVYTYSKDSKLLDIPSLLHEAEFYFAVVYYLYIWFYDKSKWDDLIYVNPVNNSNFSVGKSVENRNEVIRYMVQLISKTLLLADKIKSVDFSTLEKDNTFVRKFSTMVKTVIEAKADPDIPNESFLLGNGNIYDRKAKILERIR